MRRSHVVGVAVTLATLVGAGGATVGPAQAIVATGCTAQNGTPAALINDINAAQANGGGTVTLDNGCIYDLTQAGPAGAHGADGLPPITTPITVQGNGATIQRDAGASTPQFRIFEVTSTGSLTLNFVTIKGGRAADGADGSAGTTGAAGAPGQVNLGTCQATPAGAGGTGTAGGNGGSGGNGGGIYNAGIVMLNGATNVTGNSAGNGGNGGAGGAGGPGGGGGPGAPSCPGGNGADGGAGGNGGGGGAAGTGGGIFNDTGATLDIASGAVVSLNAAGNGGTPGKAGDGGAGGQGGSGSTQGTSGATGAPGAPGAVPIGGDGGGIANLGAVTIIGAQLFGNHAGQGGAGAVGGTTLGDQNGEAAANGGDGGGIWNGATLTVNAGSSFTNNTAGTGGNGGNATSGVFDGTANAVPGDGGHGGNGGNGGAIRNDGSLTINNSAGFTGNHAGIGEDGGGPGVVSLCNPTCTRIEGTAGADGVNGADPDVSPPPPAFTSPASTSVPEGMPLNFHVVATGASSPASENGSLPQGFTYSPGPGSGEGTLSGSSLQQSTSHFQFLATNTTNHETTVQDFTLTVGASAGSPYHALTPTRILDTRSDPSFHTPSNGPTTIPAFGNLDFKVTGTFGSDTVPDTATAIVLNVAEVNGADPGNLTLWPTGQPLPNTANANWAPGQTVSNLVEVAIGNGGQVSVHNASASAVDVVYDLEGYVGPGAGTAGQYIAIPPTRALDTRPASPTHTGPANGPIASGQLVVLQATGIAPIPASGVSAVVFNVTATEQSGDGDFTVFPDGIAQPNVANLNYRSGEDIGNRVVVPVSAQGKVDFANFTLQGNGSGGGSVEIVADAVGYFTDGTMSGGSTFNGVTPVRIADTRADQQFHVGPNTTLGPDGTITISVAGVAPVPADAKAVVLNVAVTNTTQPSFLTVYPQDPRPTTADINWLPGVTRSNLVPVQVGPDGGLRLFNFQGNVDVVVDVLGYYA